MPGTDAVRRALPAAVGALVVLVSGLGSCTCDQSPTSGAFIPCDTEHPCPEGQGLACEEGVCVYPDGGTYTCTVPLPGCPCEQTDPAQITCSIPQDVVGSCRHGLSTCQDGRYGECTLIADPACSKVHVDQGSIPLTPDNSDNVQKGVDGDIVLDPDTEQVTFGYLWIANTGENTVSKLDIDTGREVARYASVRDSAALGLTPVPLGGHPGDESTANCGNCPSRTAIDFHGDAFVANRAFTRQGSVTKFANAIENCIDRDGNGAIETSTDVNDDGIIDVNDPDEFLGENDECILWTVKVGNGLDGVPRALAIDGGGPDGENGNVWVGLFNEQRAIQLSGDTGAPILDNGQPVSIDLQKDGHSVHPYGAAIDSAQHVWMTDIQGAYLARIDSINRTLVDLYEIPQHNGVSNAYGIAVDVGQRVWLGGYQALDVKVFTPSSGEWQLGPIMDTATSPTTRGIAIDAAGDVWFAMTPGYVGRVRGQDILDLGESAPVTEYQVPSLPAPWPQGIQSTIGVGIDRNGACWVVSRNDRSAIGAATRIKPDGTAESFPVGKRPYTYSDFTGYGLLTVVRPQGWFRVPIEGCPGEDQQTQWKTLTWSESEPVGTAVRLKVRAADTLADLAAAPWFGPWDTPPVDLQAQGVPPSRYLEVEVDLSSADPDISPSFGGFDVEFDACAVGPG